MIMLVEICLITYRLQIFIQSVCPAKFLCFLRSLHVSSRCIALLVSGLVAGGLWELFGAQYCFAGGVVFAVLTLVLIQRFRFLAVRQ